MRTNTKMTFIVLSFTLLFTCMSLFAQNNPSHFKCEMDFGGGTVFSTFLDYANDQNQFTITSLKNADVRIMGGKAKLGRLMGKSPKKGIIMTIKGTQKNDSLFGDTAIYMFGKLKFRGTVNNENLSGELLNSDGMSIGKIQGISSAEDRISYKELYPKLMNTVQENIYSKEVLQTKGWKKFEKQIEELCSEAHDDIELYFGFNILARSLPFTHLTLIIAEIKPEDEETTDSDEKPDSRKSVIFEEKNSSTAYLQVKNFSDSATELELILPKIVGNPAYKNLIIDLRDNGGGGITPAFALAKHIVTEDLEVGYFPTNKLSYSGFDAKAYANLPELQPKSTNDFGNELRTSAGVKLIFKKPENPVFSGNLYVLTNGRTASTCEPIVYALKNTKKAIIIGEKTYGGMLAASPFVVLGKYMLMIPIADFYTYDGVHLDKVGVEPNIEVKSEDALNKAMEIINGAH